MIELRDLRCFLTVADELHFGRAARRLNIGEAPLSEQIRHLEQSLGIALFERDRRHAQLTPAGATLVSGARRTLSELERAVDDAQRSGGERMTLLRVSCSPHALHSAMPTLLQRVRDALPHARVDVSAESPDGGVMDLVHGRAEVALVTGPVGDDELSHQGVRAQLVHRERFHLALPAGHCLLEKRQVPLRALWNEEIVFLSQSLAPELHGVIVSACQGAGFSPRLVEADSFDAVLHCAAARNVIGLLPASYVSLVHGVGFRALTGMTATADIALLYIAAGASPLVHAFAGSARGATRVQARIGQ